MKNIIMFFLFYVFAFGYAPEMNELYNLYYMGNSNYMSNFNEKGNDLFVAIDKVKNLKSGKVEKQTYENLITVMDIYINPKKKRETYNMLKIIVNKNTPPFSDKDPNYMASLADLTSALLRYSSTLNEVMKYGAASGELYENALKINPNHFPSLLGVAISTAFRPRFVGGGLDKAMPIFQKAEANAKEKWEKHLIYVWMSQAYLKSADNENYNKYMKLARDIFPEGAFVNMVVEMNENGKNMFDNDY